MGFNKGKTKDHCFHIVVVKLIVLSFSSYSYSCMMVLLYRASNLNDFGLLF